PIRGSAMARTSKLVLPIWKGPLGQTYWRPCLSRPGYPERRSCPTCRKIFPTQWTNIPPRGASPPRPSWGKFTSSGTSHNQHLNSRPVIGPRLGAHPPSEPQHHANRTSSITDEHTRTPY